MGILRSLWTFVFYISAISIQLIHSEQLIGKDNAIYTFDEQAYETCKFIGEGAYGRILRGKKKPQNSVNEIDVALKFETIKYNEKSTVAHEAKIYSVVQGHKSIPKFHDLLTYDHYDEVLILDLLGNDLSKLEIYFEGFSIKTTMMIGIQMLDVIEYLHDKGIVHNDIKSGNIAVGLENPSDIYLFDFGQATFYKEDDSKIDKKDKDFYWYTPEDDLQKNRSNDIISLAYMLIRFVEGFKTTLELEDSISQESIKSEKDILKHLRKIPTKNTFAKFLMNALFAKPKDKPDYEYLKKLLQEQLEQMNENIDLKYDWIVRKDKNKRSRKN